jgi:LysM domain
MAVPGRVAVPGRMAVPVGEPAPDQSRRPARRRATAPAGAPMRREDRVRRARPASRKVRLTRRGRLVVWTLAALAIAAVLTPVLLMAAAGAQAANHGLPPAAARAGLRHVVVRPGQTLWSIASAAEPAADPRVVIQEIMQVNALSSGVVVPGESLWVPGN